MRIVRVFSLSLAHRRLSLLCIGTFYRAHRCPSSSRVCAFFRGASALIALSVGIGRLGRVQSSLDPRAACVIGRRFSARPFRMRFCVRLKTQCFSFTGFAPLSSSVRAGGSSALASLAPCVDRGAVRLLYGQWSVWARFLVLVFFPK